MVNMRIVYEHELISKPVDLFIMVDGLNVKQSEGIELLLRRLQLMEDAVAFNPSDPSFDGADHYMGTGERRGGALVAPSLRARVAAELGREAAVAKEMRKAREAKGASKGK